MMKNKILKRIEERIFFKLNYFFMDFSFQIYLVQKLDDSIYSLGFQYELLQDKVLQCSGLACLAD